MTLEMQKKYKNLRTHLWWFKEHHLVLQLITFNTLISKITFLSLENTQVKHLI